MTSAIRSWLGRHWLPWLPAVLGPALVFVPALLRGQALFWGTPLLQFIPWRVYAKLLVAEGQLPLWNPLLGMGAPLLANYQSALLYPPNWLLLLLDVAWGQTLLAALHLTFAALGMAVLAKRLGLSRFAQTVAAVTYGLSGYLVTRAGFLSINATAAWLPWIVWAGDRLVLGHTIGPSGRAISVSGKRSTIDNATHPRADHNTPLRDIGLLAITLALQWLAGHAQLAWYSLLFAGAWMAVRRLVRYGWSGLRPPPPDSPWRACWR